MFKMFGTLTLLALTACTLPTDPTAQPHHTAATDDPGSITITICLECNRPTGPEKDRRRTCQASNPWVNGQRLGCR